MKRLGLVLTLCGVLAGGVARDAAAQGKPEGEIRFAVYVTLSPLWFDPAEVLGFITPFWVMYGVHDALVKPMPGNLMTPSLAESWTVSADQKVYEFKLREGVKFHNGDPFTAEDVKFSFGRVKTKLLREKVKEVEVAGPARVRFHLHEPWPDFMAFYGTLASGAGWIVPKKYVEALYRQQARETDKKKREAMLHQIQQILHERVRFAPLYDYVWPSGIGPLVAEPALMLIDPYPWAAPLEEVRLKKP